MYPEHKKLLDAENEMYKSMKPYTVTSIQNWENSKKKVNVRKNLYHIQDADRPMWVVATGWDNAMWKWKRLVAKENELKIDEIEECDGVKLVCSSNDLIL